MDKTGFFSQLVSYATIFATIPAAVLCYIPMRNQRRRAWWKNVIYCGLIFIASCLLITKITETYPKINGTVALLPFLGLFFVYYAMSVRAHVSQCACTFLIVCALYSIPSFAAYIADAVFLAGGAPPSNYVFEWTQLGGVLLISIPIGIVFYLGGTYLVDHMKDWVIWFIMAAVSGIVFVVFSLLAPREYELVANPGMHRTVLIIFGLITLLYLLIIIFFIRIGDSLIRKEELQEQETVYRMQSRQYQQLEDQTEKLRVLRHDFKHSVGLLQGLANQGDIDAIQAYLSDIEKAIPQQEVTKYCDNELINTILNYYADLAREEGARVKFLVDLPQIGREQTIDLVSVLGNLLDNARQGCATVPEDARGIQLNMAAINGENLYIIVSNTFNGVVRKDGDRYLSTRRKRGRRGVGLRSIQMIAEKYGGEAKAHHEGQIFNVDITMKVAA